MVGCMADEFWTVQASSCSDDLLEKQNDAPHHGVFEIMMKIDMERWGDWSAGWATESGIGALEEALEDGRVDGVAVGGLQGWARGDLVGLEKCLRLARILVVVDPEGVDLGLVADLPMLESLQLGRGGRGFSLMGMKSLRRLHCGPWLPDGWGDSRLQSVCLFDVDRPFVELVPMNMATELMLIGGRCKTLDGVEGWKSLESLTVASMRGLVSIKAAADLKKLKYLSVERCKKIGDWEEIVGSASLETLVMAECGRIGTLKWCADLMGLREMRFTGLQIDDGDVGVLGRLRKVLFANKKSYSHSMEEVQGMCDEYWRVRR